MLAPCGLIPGLTFFVVHPERVRLRDLGAAVIAFYLYDWTST
jgi:hypothetical protein